MKETSSRRPSLRYHPYRRPSFWTTYDPALEELLLSSSYDSALDSSELLSSFTALVPAEAAPERQNSGTIGGGIEGIAVSQPFSVFDPKVDVTGSSISSVASTVGVIPAGPEQQND